MRILSCDSKRTAPYWPSQQVHAGDNYASISDLKSKRFGSDRGLGCGLQLGDRLNGHSEYDYNHDRYDSGDDSGKEAGADRYR